MPKANTITETAPYRSQAQQAIDRTWENIESEQVRLGRELRRARKGKAHKRVFEIECALACLEVDGDMLGWM